MPHQALPIVAILCTKLILLAAAAGQTELNVTVNTQGYQNYFLRQNNTSVVTLLSASPGITQRLLVATPAGNSGAFSYFNSTDNNTSFHIALVNSSLHTAQQGSNSGIAGMLSFSSNATLTRAIVGSVRTMRDYVEGSGLTHDTFSHTLIQQGPSILLSYHYINGSNSVNLTFTPADTQTTLSPLPDGNFSVTVAGSDGLVNFTWISTEEQLPGYSPAELFMPDSNLANTSEAQQVCFAACMPNLGIDPGWLCCVLSSMKEALKARTVYKALSTVHYRSPTHAPGALLHMPHCPPAHAPYCAPAHALTALLHMPHTALLHMPHTALLHMPQLSRCLQILHSDCIPSQLAELLEAPNVIIGMNAANNFLC